jgi:AraC-like DNA-binding protein
LLTIIQVIAILQGIFLVFVLFQRKQSYKKTNFWLFIGCLVSAILFALGDDDYNLLVSDSKWIFFHEPLMITFFFLFIRYSNTERDEFAKADLLFFLPYLLFLLVEFLSSLDSFEDNIILELIEGLLELSFLGMLLYSIYDIFKSQKEKWLLAFLIPFAVVLIVDELLLLFLEDKPFGDPDSYGAFLITLFLFYFITYRLVTAPKDILTSANNKYRLSNLSKPDVQSKIDQLDGLMREQQLFKNPKLSASEVAEQLGISRQQLSEILNVHLETRFQDYLNQYRVEAFIKCLDQEDYKNYTLLGIATEVGFSSKSSFNATFKKLKGMTPSQYKKSEK